MDEINNILTNWDKVVQILTILIAITTALFAYLSILSSKKLTTEQIEFNKKLHNQEIMLSRPIISCTGSIAILDGTFYNINFALKNIGKRTLNNLSIKYYVISKSESGINLEFNEKYLNANPLDNGLDQTLFERLPRTNSQKEIFYKIKLDFDDALTRSKETQEFYYIFPTDQQKSLDKNKTDTVALFGATQKHKEFINNSLDKLLAQSTIPHH
jgi:hypothetical protein